MTTWPAGIDGLRYGGDYNPEQWPEQVWYSDVKRMREAGVNLVSVAVFAWAPLEPEQGRYDLGWLDRVLERLDGAGIRVDLATATASPPPWLAARHPETLPVDRDGRRAWPGGRQAYCPSSPVYRERALALVEQLANRYRGHPALAMWHAGNEYGCHNAHCYCDVSAAAFRAWLRRRYDTLLDGAEAVAAYGDGPLPGTPAVTRNRRGAGQAWYLATRLDAAATGRVLLRACVEAGVTLGGTPSGVEVVRRAGDGRSYLFVLNHEDAAVEVETDGVDLVGGGTVRGTVTVPAGGVAVVRENPASGRPGRREA